MPVKSPVPASLAPRPVSECDAVTYEDAINCGLRWREDAEVREAEKAAARKALGGE